MPTGTYERKPCSEITKKKISNSRLKRKTRIGYLNSLKSRKKMSEAAKKRLSIKENHWNWQGGITSENKKIRNSLEMSLWREAVFARDNWTCQKCGESGGYLHPHHIFNFAAYLDLRFAIDNGITLCKECHKKLHKKYGRKNNTRKQLEEFISL